MATRLTRFAQAPIVVSSTANHEGTTYAHWKMETSPRPGYGVPSYERNIEIVAGRYLAQVTATGPDVSLTDFHLFTGDGDSFWLDIPAGGTSWTTVLDITGSSPILRLMATGYDHLLLVLHRI